jgi:hypothetical protein
MVADDHAAHRAPPAPPARFEAPAPGTYELPAIDRVPQRYLLGTRGVAEPLLGLASGELALISFVYLQCGEACPLATAMLHRLDGELAKDAALSKRVELVTVSFDPQRDTPEKMRELRKGLAPRGRCARCSRISARTRSGFPAKRTRRNRCATCSRCSWWMRTAR